MNGVTQRIEQRGFNGESQVPHAHISGLILSMGDVTWWRGGGQTMAAESYGVLG